MPRIEIVGYRDPDFETDLHLFVDGVEVTDYDEYIADPGAGYELHEWKRAGEDYAKHASPAAAEYIRQFWAAGEESEFVTEGTGP